MPVNSNFLLDEVMGGEFPSCAYVTHFELCGFRNEIMTVIEKSTKTEENS
jgi:hypothetical protein